MRRFLQNDGLLTRVQDLKPVAAVLGLSMAQLAVAWVLQNPNVAAAIIGASRPEQVHDNVKAAGVTLDAGVTTFDTADAYANGAADTVLGEALAAQRRESLDILTKAYWPTGLRSPNDTGPSRKHLV